jgi:hypothetical protein
VSHHTLQSPSCGFLDEGFMLIETNSKLGFERIDVNNLRSLIKFVLHGITNMRTNTFSSGQRTSFPLTTETIGLATINGATIMVCVW